jgi:hypothetical protein
MLMPPPPLAPPPRRHARRSCRGAPLPLLLLLALLLPHTQPSAAAAAAAPSPPSSAGALPAGTREVDAALFYAALTPSPAEWAATFGADDPAYGPVHFWLRCVARDVRAFFFLENASAPPANVSAAHAAALVELGKFTLQLDGYTVRTEMSDVGEFYFALPPDQAPSGVVKITVPGWRHYIDFPLRTCEPPPPPLPTPPPPAKRIMNIYTWDEERLDSPLDHAAEAAAAEVTRVRMETFAAGLVTHMRYHMCALRIERYEVVVQEEIVPILLSNAALAAAVKDGTLHFLLKGNHPGHVAGSRPFWQGLYENMAVLTHWRGHAALYFWDIDEFVVDPHDKLDTLNAILDHNMGHKFLRRRAVCTDCAFGVAQATFPLKGHALKELDDEWLLPKVVMNPERTGCAAIHYADCGKRVTKMDEKIAYLAHFTSWVVVRAEDDSDSEAEAAGKYANLRPLKLVERCM